MEKLKNCPNWPALLDIDTAALYLGGKPRRLFALIARGYLTPFSHRHRSTDFTRAAVDTALRIAAAKGDNLSIPTEVKSVQKALDYKREHKIEAVPVV